MTEDELVQALRNAQFDNVAERAGFKTLLELAEDTGWGKDKLYKELKRMKDAGDLEVGKIYEVNLADVLQPKTAYRLKANGRKPEELDKSEESEV